MNRNSISNRPINSGELKSLQTENFIFRFWQVGRWLGAFAGVLLLVACASVPAHTPPTVDAAGEPIINSIFSIETVVLGGVEQTITIRGVDRSKPVLLFLHGGPGVPSSPWATWREYYADLEANFVLVHWDQRGAGKSYSKNLRPDDMHLEKFVSDTLELADMLRQRFGQNKIFLWGHSWGSGLGFETLRVNSLPFHAFFASGVRPEWNASQELGYELVLQLARDAADVEAVEALTAIKPFDATNPEHRAVRGRFLSQYLVGEMRTPGLEQAWLDYVLSGKSPEYPRSTIRDTMEGITFTRETIGLEIVTSGYNLMRDFPESDIPVYFLSGRYDYETPGELAEEYFEMLKAPAKRFIWFENAAHDLNFDEPDKFSNTLISIAYEILEGEE